MPKKKQNVERQFSHLAKPYLVWLYILALFPAIVMFILIFFDSEGIDLKGATFSLKNFSQLVEISTLIAFLNSIVLSILSTIICAVLGYVVAYKLFKSKMKNKFIILTIIILPMWVNVLLRIEALGNIMEPNNMITGLLSKIGINLSINIRGTFIAVLLGLVFTYLPFMILPIYTALEKVETSLEEAALDLGLTHMQKFWKIIFPLSFKGIVTGSIMVLLPCLSGFAIPEILGKGNILMIGNVIEQMFKSMNYNIGALIAMIILIIITISILIVNKFDKEGETLI